MDARSRQSTKIAQGFNVANSNLGKSILQNSLLLLLAKNIPNEAGWTGFSYQDDLRWPFSGPSRQVTSVTRGFSHSSRSAREARAEAPRAEARPARD